MIISSDVISDLALSYRIQCLRHIRDFFQVTFKIEVDKQLPSDDDDVSDDCVRTGCDKVLLTCVGAGYRNLNKVTL